MDQEVSPAGSVEVQEEKIKKICNDFSLLSNEQQDYILGILQALVFAKNCENNPSENPNI